MSLIFSASLLGLFYGYSRLAIAYPPFLVAGFKGLARTMHIRCIHGTFGREITKYTVIYSVYIRFWPTLGFFMECTALVHVVTLFLNSARPWHTLGFFMECTALVHVASSLRAILPSFQLWCADLRTASLLFAWLFAFLPVLVCRSAYSSGQPWASLWNAQPWCT